MFGQIMPFLGISLKIIFVLTINPDDWRSWINGKLHIKRKNRQRSYIHYQTYYYSFLFYFNCYALSEYTTMSYYSAFKSASDLRYNSEL